MAINPYSFPEKNKFRAKEITQPDFDIVPFYEELYVNFDDVRRELYDLEGIRFTLNLDGEELVTPTTYIKIIFSGHAGCGKTLELRRFHKAVNHPNRYFSILLNLEEETELSRFESEDLFVFLITKLIDRMREAGLKDIPKDFAKLANDWLSNQELQKELKKTYNLEIEGESSAGFSFWSFLTAKAGLKALFSGQSETVQTIRYKIRDNPNELVERFNAGLDEARQMLSKANLGRDILFIVDGSEKMKYATYQKIFVDDSQMIRDVAANMICCVPINSFYQINNSLVKDYFEPVVLPMIPINDKSCDLLESVISRRIDSQLFFEKGVLRTLVKFSGGCLRQLIRLVNKGIVQSKGGSITANIAQKVAHELGREMFERLSSKHLTLLQSGKFDSSDSEIQDLLFSLALLKYNGARRINPLLEPYLSEKGSGEV